MNGHALDDRGTGKIITKSKSKVTDEWDITKKSRGLGDTVAKITHYTGLSRLAKKKENITGKPCGCSKRQKSLNKKVPYVN